MDLGNDTVLTVTLFNFLHYFYLGEIALESCAGFCLQQRKSALIIRLSPPS